MMKFGFGRTLNSDLVNELKGLVPSSEFYQVPKEQLCNF